MGNRRTRMVWAILAIGFVMLPAALGAQEPADPPAAGDTDRVNTPPMPAEEAARGFRVPEGFRVQVFASEPEITNPIALDFDNRGRLWLAENHTYAEREVRFDLNQTDRVVILTDDDGDGRHDRRTVFTTEVKPLTSIALGRGGLWLMAPPNLVFVAERNRDDVPDGPAEVILDGFTVPQENYHNFANGLKWGPDGWLYGRCGASAPGDVGPPGTPADQRIPLRGGLWRYHPEQRRFESLNGGTTNPWGHDWTALGEPLFINTVNGHLWHAFAGAHFVRPHTIDPNPYVYELIDQHADHWHWDNSKDWTDSRNPTAEHSSRGGGHAHSGMVIYQGDNWPEAFRGKLLTLNFHGRRANVERLDREGSGLVGRHEFDTLFAADLNFRGIDLATGPDGGVYVLDWSDTGECHESNGVQRSSGRIYKVTYGDPGRTAPPGPFDLARSTEAELAAYQSHPNDLFARLARLELADRAAVGRDVSGIDAPLKSTLVMSADPVMRLRALWTLHAAGRAEPSLLKSLLNDTHESVRAWAIRILTDNQPLDTVMSRRPVGSEPRGQVEVSALVELAGSDPSGLVRLMLASTLQRLPVVERPALARALAMRAEDAGDHNLPLMVWYGLIPVAEVDPGALATIALDTSWPTLRRLCARRLTDRLAGDPKALDALVGGLTKVEATEAALADLLAGMSEGLKGWRKAPRPAGWEDLMARLARSADPALASRGRELGVVFGDGRALGELRAIALDGAADLATRRNAIEALVEARPEDLRSICEALITTRFVNASAARGLVLFDDPKVGVTLVRSYGAFHPSERPALLDAMVQRPAIARALLDAMAAGTIPRSELTAFQARQIASLNDAGLTERLTEVWGALHATPEARKAEIAAWKVKLAAPEPVANLSGGRAVFNQVCATCHTLYGQGRNAGPDLTGAGRNDLDYLVDNILDPGATVTADFRLTVVALKDGRVLNGILKSRTDRALTLRTQDGEVVLPLDEVDEESRSDQSLMPEGLLTPLSEQQVRDLIGYLRHPSQVPLPPGAPEAPAP
jgi:putative membrane-bound dehydrogenase-like protein